MITARAMCGVTSERVAAFRPSCSLQNISNGGGQLWMKLDDQWVLMLMKGHTSGIELSIVHL